MQGCPQTQDQGVDGRSRKRDGQGGKEIRNRRGGAGFCRTTCTNRMEPGRERKKEPSLKEGKERQRGSRVGEGRTQRGPQATT